MGRILVTGDGTQPVFIYVVRPGGATTPGNSFYSQTFAAAGNWAGLQDLRGFIHVRAVISGNLTASILIDDVDGRSNGLENFSTVGSIQATIQSGSAGAFNVQAASTTANGDLICRSRVNQVAITSGQLLGDVKSLNSSIGDISVTAGDVGSSSNYVAIEAAGATSGLHITRINATRDFYGHVDCNTSTTAIDGVINNFTVGTAGTPSAFGDFHGSLKLGSFNEQITIIRDCYGTIQHGGVMPPGVQPNNTH
jgi:hypothetical protein